MECCELSISVGELIGVPKVSMSGYMDAWHEQTVAGVLYGFRDKGTTSLVLDIAGLNFAGIDGATTMINILRSIGPQMCVHIVSSGPQMSFLMKAEMGPCVKIYSTLDELAEYVTPLEQPLTSRWMAETSTDNELPLAA